MLGRWSRLKTHAIRPRDQGTWGLTRRHHDFQVAGLDHWNQRGRKRLQRIQATLSHVLLDTRYVSRKDTTQGLGVCRYDTSMEGQCFDCLRSSREAFGTSPFPLDMKRGTVYLCLAREKHVRSSHMCCLSCLDQSHHGMVKRFAADTQVSSADVL